eukprot:CCRYP_005555-RA/>CCRYP_005555-RA protein AED:0.07 eAED:0.04 QI:0/0.5/0.33/1/1/1/3/195/391
MGTKTESSDASLASIIKSIIDTIRNKSKNGKSMELKSLRKAVLVATKHLKDENSEIDKPTKKFFKGAVQTLENGRVSLSADGTVKLSKSERSSKSSLSVVEEDKEQSLKKASNDKKKKKRESVEESDDPKDSKKQKTIGSEDYDVPHDAEDGEGENSINGDNGNEDEPTNNDSTHDEEDTKDKNKPCKGNPNGITRLFLGNLPFAVTDSTLNDHLNSMITHVKWITDKTTGKFYGSAFCEVRNSRDAAKAVTEINGSKLMGRPIKINYAPMQPGQEKDWPPKQRVITGGKVANSAGQAGGQGVKAMSVKPDGCCKLFIGNLSYDLDEDGITKFFMAVDAEVKAVRWLYHKESGDFKGCGYVDFWNTEACEKAATLNGKNLLGRPIRIDWAE